MQKWLKLTIDRKIQQLSIVSAYYQAIFEHAKRCEVEIFLVHFSSGKGWVFDLDFICWQFKKLEVPFPHHDQGVFLPVKEYLIESLSTHVCLLLIDFLGFI